MSDLSKNGNGVPASSTRFARFHLEWIPLLPTPTAQTVFLVLLAHANPQGECWPKQTTIASLTGVLPRRVREALRDLEKCGALETIHKKGGRSKYKVSFLPPNGVRPELGLSMNRTEAGIRPEVRPDLGPCHGPDLGRTRNRPGNIDMNKTSRARARARDDGQEKTNDDESRTTAFDAEENERKTTLRQPTDGEARVLAVCWQWQRGVSMPMPADLVELYRAMRPVHDLPQRPGA
jgi:Helix-turn-helix domain